MIKDGLIIDGVVHELVYAPEPDCAKCSLMSYCVDAPPSFCYNLGFGHITKGNYSHYQFKRHD